MKKLIRTKLSICVALFALSVGLLTSCVLKSESKEFTMRDRLLSREQIVFMCQHPQGKAMIPAELSTHAAQVDVISPMWFDVHSDGSVKLIFEDIEFDEYMAFCRENEIAVLPVFRNFKPKDFLLNPNSIDRAVQEISEILKANDFDGLMLDIEEDSSDIRTKEPMLSFMSRVHQEVQMQGRVLSVSFNPVYWGRGWQNEVMLEYCDWAFAMFYDYSGPWNKDALNATAPYQWPERDRDIQRDVARIMTKANSPKIIFGIPAYGNGVTLDATGKCVDFDVAYVNTFLAEKERVGAARQWDVEARTPRFEYMTAGGQRIVWYEDEESYTWRMALAGDLQAAGVGVWSIGAKGGLDDAIWLVLQAYKEGALY